MDFNHAPRRRRRWLWPVVGVAVVAVIAAGLLVARNGQANGERHQEDGKHELGLRAEVMTDPEHRARSA